MRGSLLGQGVRADSKNAATDFGEFLCPEWTHVRPTLTYSGQASDLEQIIFTEKPRGNHPCKKDRAFFIWKTKLISASW
jgi:hypothetical protein